MKKLVVGLLAASTLATPALASVGGAPTQPLNEPAQISPATGTTLVNVYTAGPNGAQITGIPCIALGAYSNYPMAVGITRAGVNLPLFSPALYGNSGLASNQLPTEDIFLVQGQQPSSSRPLGNYLINSEGNAYFPLRAGDTLTLSVTTALTGSQSITCHVEGQQF